MKKEGINLKGLKMKVCFEMPMRSLKVINECEEKFYKKLQYKKTINKDEKAIVTFRKFSNNVKYKILLKENHISIYVENVVNSRIEEILSEINKCLELFRIILYNYNGVNPKITSVVFTKGYDMESGGITEYLKETNFAFNRDGISISLKYVDKKDMNLLIRTYICSNELLDDFFNNSQEYIKKLYETSL